MAGARSTRGKLRQGLLVGLAGAALALGLWAFGILDAWEARTFDWRVQLLARPGAATDRVRLIMLDQASLDWGATENGLSWPWPREVYAAVTAFCRRAGAASLSFDVLFTEPSAYGPADDAALGAALAEYGRAVVPLFLSESSGMAASWPEGRADALRVAGLADWLGDGQRREALSYPQASLPVPDIAAGTRVLADVNMAPDPDGVYRRVRLLGFFDGHPVPSLGLAALLAASPDPGAAVGEGTFRLDGSSVPIDGLGQAILNYRGPSGTHRTFSAAAVIQSELKLQEGAQPSIDPSELADRHVIFGFSAPGLFDLRPAPVSGVYPGPEVFATMLDNLLAGDFIAPVPAWATAALTALLALAAGLAGAFLHGAGGGGLLTLCALVLPAAGSLAAYRAGLWLPLLPLEAAGASVVFGSILANYATEGRQKRFIKSAFGQYLSHAVIDELLKHPDRLKLGGERRELSIFFSDLQGFTGISEGLEPEQLTHLLNEYLTAMTDIIHEAGGTVDKFEGDAIIAFWNAPLTQPDHAARAVGAALACQKRLSDLRPHFRDLCGKDLFMRIGLNTGPAVVGNMGSNTRFDYTMLGDAVNLAARLEGINKEFGTCTMISEASRAAMAGAYPVRELSRVRVVGRQEPVVVFEPMSAEDLASRREPLEAFGRALALFYAGHFKDALAGFLALAEADQAAAAYARKCVLLLENPPEDWDGVWTMTSK
jgi:adenylate cyclase